MTEQKQQELKKKAEAGDTQAQIELSHALEAKGQDNAAVSWLRTAIAGGDVRAKTQLAKRFLTRAPLQSEEGTALLFLAAAEGDAEAAHVAAVLYASGIAVERDWSVAFDYLTRAAELGFSLAQDELYLLATGAIERNQGREPDPAHWKKLCKAIDLPAWVTTPPQKLVSRDPRIMVVEGAVPSLICDWLIERAKPHRAAASVFDQKTGELHYSKERTNSVASFDTFKRDMIFAVLRLRIASLTGLSFGMEVPNILHYTVGQCYGLHFDFIAATKSDATRLTQGRQRVLTFLLYLNDDYEGGETCFPRISWQHKGRKGDAMFFWNVDTQGQPDPKTLHEGSAPTKGEKWLFSQWIQQDTKASFPHHRT
jgi:prolyl 4-hydroxylase